MSKRNNTKAVNNDFNMQVRHSAKTFASALALILSVRTAQALLARRRKNDAKAKSKPTVTATAVKLALFPAIFPPIYAALRKRLGKDGGIAETLASSSLLLLPKTIRIQFALYATSAALLHSGRTSRTRQLLPPVWTLNVIGNAILLWAFLFRSKAFPASYEKIILSHSRQYAPAGMSKAELEDLLANTNFPAWDAEPPTKRLRHHNQICSKLHPEEPSCIKNFGNAWIKEVPHVGKWVGAFSALPIILSTSRRRGLKKAPLPVLKSWLQSTALGTAFVVGSINTSWAMTCLLQRILPPGYMSKSRWLLNGSVGSLWILILPAKRRAELALYVARLAALCSWNIWKIEGGPAIPYGELILFALSWIQLSKLRQRGEKISGLVGFGLERLNVKDE